MVAPNPLTIEVPAANPFEPQPPPSRQLHSFVEEVRHRRRAALRDSAIWMVAAFVGSKEARRIVALATDEQVAEFLRDVTREESPGER